MPYDKILDLVESKQLDITAVSLSEITSDFLDYVRNLREPASRRSDPHVLADFVAVAAKLLLIKSKALLPSIQLSQEEESDIKELEERLKIYQRFRLASHHLKNILETENRSFARPYLIGSGVLFRPPKKIAAIQLWQSVTLAAEKIGRDIGNWQKNQELVKIKIISIETKIKELMVKFTQSLKSRKFSQLIKDRTKSEMVVVFLAVLHLLKENKVTISQQRPFQEIYVERV